MTTRWLSRNGTVLASEAGCTSIEVSVPCTSCRIGCAARSRAQPLEFSVSESQDLRFGEQVEVSVSAHAVTGLCARLFGPAIGWMLICLAAEAPWWPGTPLADPVQAAVAVADGAVFWLTGLIAALVAGHVLARRQAASLELKVRLQGNHPATEVNDCSRN